MATAPEDTTKPLPSPLSVIANNKDLRNALMEALDLELVCSTEDNDPKIMKLIDPDDLFGYDNQHVSPGTGDISYRELYTICATGTGGAFHIWYPSKNNKDAGFVVYLGSEGERAKVGRSVSEFLQLVCSFAPYFFDVISDLPGINTLPDNCDISGATAQDFNVANTAIKVQNWLSQDDDTLDIQQAATQVLDVIQKPKLTITKALEALISAHLAEPRFAILSADDVDEE
mmetsp:Transcript_23044/g.48054  ORF Transcript_23044/g.48054 Transcript_23044/m.48054 type:complete len:230 (-) Transcript_23044:151-840(-)